MAKIFRKKKRYFRGRTSKRRWVTKTPNKGNYRKYTWRRKAYIKYPHKKVTSMRLLKYTGMTKNLLPNSRSLKLKVSQPLEYIYEFGTYGNMYSDHIMNIDQMMHPDNARTHTQAGAYRFCRVRGMKIKLVPYPYPHDGAGNEVGEDRCIAPHVFYYGWSYLNGRFTAANITHEEFNKMCVQKYYAWQYNNAKHSTKFYIPWPHKLFEPYLKTNSIHDGSKKRFDAGGWWNCREPSRWVDLTGQAGEAPWFHYGFRHVLPNTDPVTGISLHFGHLVVTHYLEFKGATSTMLMGPMPQPDTPGQLPETDLEEEQVFEEEPPKSEKSVTKICRKINCMVIKKSP